MFGTAILVYSTWSFKQIAMLKGHSGKVKTIAWSSDDRKIISGVVDGHLYKWDVVSGVKEWETDVHAVLYSSVSVSPNLKNIYVAGSDGIIRVKIVRRIYGGWKIV